MDGQSLLWVLGGMQGITILLVGWIRWDNKKAVDELWKRADSHGHSIKCNEDGCRPRTCAVIIHETKE